MRKTLVIALREYKASVKTKAFIISLVIMPVLMGGSILVQVLLKDVGDKDLKKFAVVDRTPRKQMLSQLQEALKHPEAHPLMDPDGKKKTRLPFILVPVEPSANTPTAINQQRYELSEQVRKGELFGFVEIGADVLAPVQAQAGRGKALKPGPEAWVRYQTNSPTYLTFPNWVQVVVNARVQLARLQETRVPPQALAYVLKSVPLEARGLSAKDAQGDIEEAPDQNRAVAFIVPFGLMMLMFMVVMVGATPLVQGIVEEKMQRIAEVLLGSVRPFDLMMGKLLGMVGVSLTLVAVYLGGAYVAARFFEVDKYFPLELLGWFLVFQTLTVLMFGSLFIAIGAACTDTKETQAMLMPVMILACVPMFFMGPVLRDPNSPFAVGASFFPFATPMLMIARQAIPPGIPLWQPVLGVVVVLATTLLCVYAAGRIFRVGILMQGKGARFGDLVKWVFRG